MSRRSRPKSKTIVPGSRVTLREGLTFDISRQHLRSHGTRGVVGTVIEWRSAAWAEWVHVRFDGCPIVHRLTEAEISLARRSES